MKHVVIIGGGFAGLTCARTLASHSDIRITLIDQNNFQQFQPLLYQVATAALAPSNAAFSLRAVLKRYSNVDIKLGSVVSVDLKSNRLSNHTVEHTAETGSAIHATSSRTLRLSVCHRSVWIGRRRAAPPQTHSRAVCAAIV
jgi:NADH dehydrogenase FAD-containing subunit